MESLWELILAVRQGVGVMEGEEASIVVGQGGLPGENLVHWCAPQEAGLELGGLDHAPVRAAHVSPSPNQPLFLFSNPPPPQVRMAAAVPPTQSLRLENASILSEGALQDGHRLWIGNLDPKITE